MVRRNGDLLRSGLRWAVARLTTRALERLRRVGRRWRATSCPPARAAVRRSGEKATRAVTWRRARRRVRVKESRSGFSPMSWARRCA